MKIYRFYLLLLLCLPSLMYAQRGSIRGKVSDAQAALVGATIYLEGTKAQGTNSDLNGFFTLNGVPAGQQNIVITYLGYRDLTLPVLIKDGEVTEVSVTLQAEFVEGEEVIISTQRRGQTVAINQQLSSDKIANIVSADRIQELPDVNAAEAIGRLPGVALQRSGGEGQKVIIRGMEPKFSAITVNGVRLPSNSGTDRSVDLSLIAPELLDAIEVFKSPLPDMDAEAMGGTVNLRLRKAPDKFHLMTRGLYGYNDQASEFKDYKGILQMSNRFLNNRLGVIAQGSIERFNRSGDFVTNTWRRGRTNDSTGVTEILGNSLRLEDRSEIRKRYNGSLSLDYTFSPKHNISLFGIFSQTNRDQFRNTDIYQPSNPSIGYTAQGLETALSLFSLSGSGEHNFDFFQVDWTVASSRSTGETPYNYTMRFNDTKNEFDPEVNANGQPQTFFAAAVPNLAESNLQGGESVNSSTIENTQTALLNVTVPFKIADNIRAEFKFGGKYYQVDRTRDYEEMAEGFYYLGGTFSSNAAERYTAAGGELTYLPTNASLIGINSFLTPGNGPGFLNEGGNNIFLNTNINPQLVRNWYESQVPILNNDRTAIVNNYEVAESITAGYAMFKFKFGDKLTVIPGFRYELSDNSYSAGVATVSGRYGVNGVYSDTTTFQRYGEFLPHLHLKYKPLEWLDIRFSYSKTMARPDFSFITPRTEINNNSATISAGNPNLKHSVSTNYDLHVSAYKGTLGLLTVGVFRKDVNNIFFPWRINLADSALAASTGYEDFRAFELNSYTNLDSSGVYGFEIDLQTNLSFLPKPFSGIVLNTNYSRLFSYTKAFFLTSETVLVNPFPPVFETTYTTQTREVGMLSQTPHIFHFSLGYDWKKFSARVSSIYQGTRATGYSLDEDFDSFSLNFWRWDASFKQGIGEKWSVFLNLNNLTNQQDISFTKNEETINTVQTFGFTGTLGLQFKL